LAAVLVMAVQLLTPKHMLVCLRILLDVGYEVRKEILWLCVNIFRDARGDTRWFILQSAFANAEFDFLREPKKKSLEKHCSPSWK
jgi:hypothetical protein